MDIKLTLIKSIFDNEVTPEKQFSASWNEFCEMLENITITDDKQSVPLISPIEFVSLDDTNDLTDSGCVRRCGDNVKSWHMLPVDIDGETTICEAKERFAAFEYVLVTTHSHQSLAKPYDCFRIFFPLATPVSNDDFQARLTAIKDFIGFADKTTTSASRSFYLPSCSADNAHSSVYFRNSGKCLNLLDFAPEIKENYVSSMSSNDAPTQEFMQEVLEKLGGLYQVEYEDWWKIGSAMCEAGFSEWEFESLSKKIRSHRTESGNGKRQDKYSVQWKLSSRRTVGGFGYLVNLCKKNFGQDCFKKTYTAEEKKNWYQAKLQAELDTLRNLLK